ncbi:MAG: response regulator transcription factor [Acidobacteria bacterium]|nr:response regulator transcription factor [Acidobacteriota bacterium]
MIRVLIADDHPVVRKGLRQFLAEEPGVQVAAEAGSAAEVLSLLGKTNPHVLLLDINMPGRSGLEALEEIRRTFPAVRVIVLSVHPEEQLGVRAIRGGAAGYLNKDAAPEELMNAIRTVSSGRKFITPALAEALAMSLDTSTDRDPHESLSSRELQLLRMIGLGKTVSEVADELALSVKTVSTYRTRLLEKMNMKTNAELTRYALQKGLSD